MQSIIGISVGRKGLVIDLIGEWLADQFGRPFVEQSTDADANLAIETFYDQFDCDFRDHAMIAIIGSIGDSVSMAASTAALFITPPDSVKCIAEIESFTFKHQGLAHAFPNRETSKIQVTFDHLPGALEFVGKSPSTPILPSGFRAPMRQAETTAWYGFGTVTDKHYKTLERLSNIVSHGVIDSDLKIRLVENV